MNDSRRAQKRFRRGHRGRTDEVLTKYGKTLAVIRPLDPALALRLVSEIPEGTPHEEAEKRFDAILEAQPYRFIGLAAKPNGGGPPFILHPRTLDRIDCVNPGDSFVDYDAMQQNAERIPEPPRG